MSAARHRCKAGIINDKPQSISRNFPAMKLAEIKFLIKSQIDFEKMLSENNE